MNVKMKCASVEKQTVGDEKGPEINTVILTPVDDGDGFFHDEAVGELRLARVSGEAAKQFQMGKEYYLEFSPAE